MNTPEIISLVAITLSILIFAWQVNQSNKQSKLQNFTHYTQRYQDILVNLPTNINSKNFSIDELKTDEKEHLYRWLRAYIDLCSEEFYLNQNKLIDSYVWRLWGSGMTDFFNKPAFYQTWNTIQENDTYGKEFKKFIDQSKNNISNV
jgi:hypothetical protein